MNEKRRATALGPHDIYLLDQWGRQLIEAFHETPYLVGSVARAEDNWRDVDLRMVIPPGIATSDALMLRTLNLALSLWGRQVTGLPIDFQMQEVEEFHSYDGEMRNPMGPRSKTHWQFGSPTAAASAPSGRAAAPEVS